MLWWRRHAPEAPSTPLERLQERASAYLDGELTFAESAAFEADLAAGDAAWEQLDGMRQVRLALASVGTVRAPRSFALTAPPAPVRSGLGRLEWATRAGTGVAALLFVAALANGRSAGDTPITLPVHTSASQAGANLAASATQQPGRQAKSAADAAAPERAASGGASAGTANDTAAPDTPAPATGTTTPPVPAQGAPAGATPTGAAASPTPAPEPRGLLAPAAAPPPAATPTGTASPIPAPIPAIAGVTPTAVATFAQPTASPSDAFRPEPNEAAAAFATRTPDPVTPTPAVAETTTPTPTPVPAAQPRPVEPATPLPAEVTPRGGVSGLAIALGVGALLLAGASVAQFAARRSVPRD